MSSEWSQGPSAEFWWSSGACQWPGPQHPRGMGVFSPIACRLGICDCGGREVDSGTRVSAVAEAAGWVRARVARLPGLCVRKSL